MYTIKILSQWEFRGDWETVHYLPTLQEQGRAGTSSAMMAILSPSKSASSLTDKVQMTRKTQDMACTCVYMSVYIHVYMCMCVYDVCAVCVYLSTCDTHMKCVVRSIHLFCLYLARRSQVALLA